MGKSRVGEGLTPVWLVWRRRDAVRVYFALVRGAMGLYTCLHRTLQHHEQIDLDLEAELREDPWRHA